jgi:hypothetical protein
MRGKIPYPVLENIKKIENYVSLTPIKGKRKYFESDNGELVIVLTTSSNNQPDGNFSEIVKDEKIWRIIKRGVRGWLYIICTIDGNTVYYRTDITTVINNREKDKKSKDENRYLCYIMTDDAKDGKKFMRINGGNLNGVTLFYVTKVNIEKALAEYTKPCYVYIMESGGKIKIGHSKDSNNRWKSFKTGNPTISLKKELKCNSESDASMFESTLHRKYKNERIGGEWFQLSDRQLIDLYEEFDWRKPSII